MSMAGYVADRTDKHVLETIKGYEGARRPLRVSASEIADQIGCSLKTVQRAIQRLEEKGALRIANQKGQPNCYEIMD